MERKTLSKESLDEVHHILVAVQLPMLQGRGGRVGRACDFGSIGCGFAARTRKLIRHHVAAFEQSCDHWRSAHAPKVFALGHSPSYLPGKANE